MGELWKSYYEKDLCLCSERYPVLKESISGNNSGSNHGHHVPDRFYQCALQSGKYNRDGGGGLSAGPSESVLQLICEW